mmetsp:Transcript_80458/g.230946  ORF Transcript_80458/g.230946 Transcript_80458/m.230946 type:complete len:198 (-) Transcript_80458:41-634(-)
MFLVAGFIYRPAKNRFGEVPLVVVGMFLRTLGFVGQALAPTQYLFAVALMVVVCGNQLIFPTTASKLTTMCHHSIYGKALGLQQSLQALARVIGPSLFGVAYDNLTHEFSFYACAAMTVIAGVLVLLAFRARPYVEEAPSPAEVRDNIDEMDRSTSFSGPLTAGDESLTVRKLARSISMDAAVEAEAEGSGTQSFGA